MKKLTLMVLLSLRIFASDTSNYGNLNDVEYVPVTHSVPIYSTVTRMIPHEVCQDQQVAVQQQSPNSPVAGIIGGVIGGVLGHQIGGGSGKVAATIGGAALGTMVGQNAASNSQTSYQTVRRCFTQYESQKETIITGYTNFAKYRGKDIAKTSDQPLKEIKIINSFSF
jgi:uncharacterized protein YcfJ